MHSGERQHQRRPRPRPLLPEVVMRPHQRPRPLLPEVAMRPHQRLRPLLPEVAMRPHRRRWPGDTRRLLHRPQSRQRAEPMRRRHQLLPLRRRHRWLRVERSVVALRRRLRARRRGRLAGLRLRLLRRKVLPRLQHLQRHLPDLCRTRLLPRLLRGCPKGAAIRPRRRRSQGRRPHRCLRQ